MARAQRVTEGQRTTRKRKLNVRKAGDRDALIATWIRHAESGDQALFWAYDALADLIHQRPTVAWTVIEELVHRAPAGSAFDLAAAGPLEDIIAWHGQEVIDFVEQRADHDETLREALSRVWLSPRDLDATTRLRFWNLGVQRIE